ncbi:MAG TPA: sensor histidine kinase [Anaerolineales bacterium]|nr:sensor histidine kinase [Anaerolineales bacterium]
MSFRSKRWISMPILGLLIILIEVIEHTASGESLWAEHFVFEIISYGVIVPILGLFLLGWIDRIEQDRDKAQVEAQRRQEFRQHLRNSPNYGELVQSIMQYGVISSNTSDMHLFVYDPSRERFNYAASWNPDGKIQTAHERDHLLNECYDCIENGAPSVGEIRRCPSSDNDSLVRDCQPLVHHGFVVGYLMFESRNGDTFSQQQQTRMATIAPEIAQAVDYVRLHALLKNQTDAESAERMRIARDLHDTLGQSLSFLRLKLDQISSTGSVDDLETVRADIGRMRDIANEAYEQMRGTLAVLQPEAKVDFESALRQYAKKASERGNFSLEFFVKGDAIPIDPHEKRQLLYICREAFNNIEKHAEAKRVIIALLWSSDILHISIEDDGKGFCPHEISHDNHYGLAIMQERARELRANLTVDSRKDSGVKVQIDFPVNTNKSSKIPETIAVHEESILN